MQKHNSVVMPNTCFYFCSILLLLSITYGCAYAPADVNKQLDVNLPASISDNEQLLWWYARYKINWPENTAPDFSVDALLADAVIEPVLVKYQDNIRLWRFHRRAHRDQAGHQFSFIFYTDKNTAAIMFNELENSDLTRKLLAHGTIDRFSTENLETNDRSSINSASDKHWSDTLQVAWPYFIMGVSATWLELINQQAGQSDSEHDLKKLLVNYQDVNNKINRIWYEEGNHAFIHHLNALFGYEPLEKEQ